MKGHITVMTGWLLNSWRVISIFRVFAVAAGLGATVPLVGQPVDEIAEEIWGFTMSFSKENLAQAVWNAFEEPQNSVGSFEQFLPEGVCVMFKASNQGNNEKMRNLRVIFQYMSRDWVYECSVVRNSPEASVFLKNIVLYRMDLRASKVFKVASWGSE